MPHNRCPVCLLPASSPDAIYCKAHREEGRKRQRVATAEMNRRRWEEWKAAGIDPSHGGEAARKRGEKISKSNTLKPRRKSAEKGRTDDG